MSRQLLPCFRRSPIRAGQTTSKSRDASFARAVAHADARGSLCRGMNVLGCFFALAGVGLQFASKDGFACAMGYLLTAGALA